MGHAQDTSLQANTSYIWRFPLIATRQEIKALTHWLDPRERDVLERLACSAEKDKRIVAWGRLRYILSRYVGCAPDAVIIEREASGRPRLSDSNNTELQFSLAHSGSLGLVGIDAHAIGVDIEKVRPTKRVDRLAARFFSSHEAAEISRQPEAEQIAWFFRQWVLKEAYLKSIGVGVPAGLSQCEIGWGPSGPSILSRGTESQSPSRKLLEIPVSKGYVAALAVSTHSTNATVFDL